MLYSIYQSLTLTFDSLKIIVQNIINDVKELSAIVGMLRDFLPTIDQLGTGWMPTAYKLMLGTCFTVVIAYKILGRT